MTGSRRETAGQQTATRRSQDGAGRGRSRRRGHATDRIALRERMPLILFLSALIIVTLGGGSSRTDVASLVYVRPCLVVLIAMMALQVPPQNLRPLRWPLLLAAVGLLLVVAQLIPLPPAIWMMLPGHDVVAGAAIAQGIPQAWRPLSLTPDLTLQAALWFLAPAAAFLGWACLTEADRRIALLAVIAVCLVSAILGGLQASGGVLYLYQRTYEGNAVGFLANRNHQGALLALAFPLLRVATLLPTRSSRLARARMIAAGVAALALVPMILLTASRAGMALGVLGIVIAGVMAPWQEPGRATGKFTRIMPLVMAGALIVSGLLVLLSGRALSVSRLFGSNVESDLRVRYAPLTFDLARQYFPTGSGAGSFDAVFRIAEPDAILKPTFFNHAHNDFLEIVLTTGVFGALLVLVGLGWWLSRGWRLARDRLNERASGGARSREWTIPLALAGWSAMLILMLASIVDYPLRTPLLGFIFAVAACWTARAPASFTK